MSTLSNLVHYRLNPAAPNALDAKGSAPAVVSMVGRFLVALIFIMSGLHKISAPEQTIGYMEANGVPLVSVALVVAIIAEIGGGLSILTGTFTRIGAAMLAAFVLVAALFFHDFWTLSGAEQQAQLIQFMKNLAICGGLILLAVFGPGSASVDARIARTLDEKPARA